LQNLLLILRPADFFYLKFKELVLLGCVKGSGIFGLLRSDLLKSPFPKMKRPPENAKPFLHLTVSIAAVVECYQAPKLRQ
jgi:hypothetical protein